jgi:hypothetical protein
MSPTSHPRLDGGGGNGDRRLSEADELRTLARVTDFEYCPQEGIVIIWELRLSGYDEDVDGELGIGFGQLSDLEREIEDMADTYIAETGAALTKVQGAHGWRVFGGTTAPSTATSASPCW